MYFEQNSIIPDIHYSPEERTVRALLSEIIQNVVNEEGRSQKT